jgi:integral membrane sensor domain MASE1
MTLLVAFRPDSWSGLLFVHLLGAFALFGGVLTSTVVGIAAARRDTVREIFLLTRVGYRMDLFVTWPGLVILVAAGLILADREKVMSQTWVQIGITLTVIGALLGGVLLAWLNHRIMKRSAQLLAEGVEHSEELQGMADNLLFKVLGLPLLTLFVALFALMTAKP